MSASKQKGTAAETAVLRYLLEQGILAYRLPLSGAQDKGDICIASPEITVEVKNCRSSQLAAWLDEAVAESKNAETSLGVVWHHRPRKGKPADWYVTMRGEDFVRMLGAVDETAL